MSITAAQASEGTIDAQRVRLDVTGMSCAACAARVEAALNKLPGVRASVNFATRVATVDAGKDTPATELCDVVRRAGYDAHPRVPGANADDDPDDDHARYLLIRLAVAAVLFVPLADLSVMFAVVPDTPVHGVAVAVDGVGSAGGDVGGVALPPRRPAPGPPRQRVDGDAHLGGHHPRQSVWSLYTVFGHHHSAHGGRGIWQALLGSDAIYFEVAAGVTVFVLAGRYFEARAKSKAGGALRALAALSAKDVTILLGDGSEMVIPADELAEQHRFVVRPGQIIAADGLVVEGTAAVDMSAMTGEAKPLRVNPGGSVIGGTVVLDGRLIVEGRRGGRRHPIRRDGPPRRGSSDPEGRRAAARRPHRLGVRSVRLRHLRRDGRWLAACRRRSGPGRSPPRWRCWSSPARVRWAWPPRPR